MSKTYQECDCCGSEWLQNDLFQDTDKSMYCPYCMVAFPANNLENVQKTIAQMFHVLENRICEATR